MPPLPTLSFTGWKYLTEIFPPSQAQLAQAVGRMRVSGREQPVSQSPPQSHQGSQECQGGQSPAAPVGLVS